MNFLNVEEEAVKQGLYRTKTNTFCFALAANFKDCNLTLINSIIENKIPYYVNKPHFFTTQLKLDGDGLLSIKIVNEHSDCEMLINEVEMESLINEKREKDVNSRFYSTRVSPEHSLLNLKLFCCSVKTGTFNYKIELNFETCKKTIDVVLIFEELRLEINQKRIDFGEIAIGNQKELTLTLKNPTNIDEKALIVLDSPQMPTFRQILALFKLCENERLKSLASNQSLYLTDEISLNECFVTVFSNSEKQVKFFVNSTQPLRNYESKILIVSESTLKVEFVSVFGSFETLDFVSENQTLILKNKTTFVEHRDNKIQFQNNKSCDLFWKIDSKQDQRCSIVWKQNEGKLSHFESKCLSFDFQIFKWQNFEIFQRVYFGARSDFVCNEANCINFKLVFEDSQEYPLQVLEWKGPLLYHGLNKIETNMLVSNKEQISDNSEKSKTNNSSNKISSTKKSQKSSYKKTTEIINLNNPQINESELVQNEIDNNEIQIEQLHDPVCLSVVKNKSEIIECPSGSMVHVIESEFDQLIGEIVFVEKVCQPHIRKVCIKNHGDIQVDFELATNSTLTEIDNELLMLLKLLKSDDKCCSNHNQTAEIQKSNAPKKRQILEPIKCQFHSLVKYNVNEKTGPLNTYKTPPNFNSESGYKLHMFKNMKTFCENLQLCAANELICSSTIKGSLLPKETKEIVLCFYGKSQNQSYSDQMKIKIDGRFFKAIPIRGSFVGQKFELLETQIFLRTIEPDYRVLTFKKLDNSISHSLKLQNLTDRPLRICLGIYSSLVDLVSLTTAQSSNKTQPIKSAEEKPSDNKTKLEHEMKQMKKQNLLKSIIIPKSKKDSNLKSIQSLDYSSNGSRILDCEFTKKEKMVKKPMRKNMEIQFSFNLQNSSYEMVWNPLFVKKEKSSFLVQNGDFIIPPNKVHEFRVSCCFGEISEDAVLIISEGPLNSELRNYQTVKLTVVD